MSRALVHLKVLFDIIRTFHRVLMCVCVCGGGGGGLGICTLKVARLDVGERCESSSGGTVPWCRPGGTEDLRVG